MLENIKYLLELGCHCMVRSCCLCRVFCFLEASHSEFRDFYRRNAAFVALSPSALGESEL